LNRRTGFKTNIYILKGVTMKTVFMGKRRYISVVLLIAAGLLTGMFVSCTSSTTQNVIPPAPKQPFGELLFVTTTDFATGSYSTVNLRDLSVDADLPSSTGIIESDNTAVYFNNKVYVINRFGFDNITVIDVSDLNGAVTQFSTGNGTNPQDMAFVSDTKAYVSLYGSNDLLVVDPTASPGNEITGSIDLSVFLDALDADGVVEASAMEIVGTYLFVALQRLDNFGVVRDGYIAVIDTESDTVVDVDAGTAGVVDPIVLTGRNPVDMSYDEGLGKIVVSETGSYFDQTDGGIEVVDPLSLEAEGYIIDETTLGGDVGAVEIVGNRIGFVVVGGFSPNKVMAFDVDVDAVGTVTGSAPRDVATDLSFISSLAVDGGKRLLVPDRSVATPGVRIFDTFTEAEVTVSPLDAGLPPNTILILFQ
jgi:hypothetical protein